MNTIPETSPHSLTARSLEAAKWGYLGAAANIIAQLVGQIVLARLLGPENFGLFVLVMVLVGIANLFADMGIGAALVQKERVNREDVRVAFTWQVILGIITGLAVCATAKPAAALLGDGRAVPVIRVMALACFFHAISAVSLGLLRREIRFKTIQFAQTAGYCFGFLGVGISLAFAGAGVWSLVGAWLSQSASSFLYMYASVRHPLRPLLRQGDRNQLASFGRAVLLTNMTNWSIENLDTWLVGRIFGAHLLGLYSIAYRLVRSPTNHLVVTLQSILFPTSARAQNNLLGLRRGYAAVLGAVLLVAAPVFWGIAAAPKTLVFALYGLAWSKSDIFLVPFALAMPFHAIMAVSGPLLWGRGRVELEFKVQFWVALLLTATVLTASQFSIRAVAWAVFAVYFVRASWLIVTVAKNIRFRLSDLAGSLRGGFLLGVCVGFTVMVTDRWLSLIGLSSPLARLGLDVVAGSASAVATLLTVPKWIVSREVGTLFHQLALSYPKLRSTFFFRRLTSHSDDERATR